MTLPFADPLTARTLGPRVVPEPPRQGDPGGPECGVCARHVGNEGVWSNERWVLRSAASTSLAGSMWLATRLHVDSFMDLPAPLAAEYGGLAGRIERAILSLGNIGRIHVYRWGDGIAHFHVWFIPRPLGMLEAQREMLMLWEDQLPPATKDEIEAAAARVGAAMAAGEVAGDQYPIALSLGGSVL